MISIARQPQDRIWWILFLGATLFMLAPSAIRADIYYWQDEQGVIHFSNQDAPSTASLYMREPEPKPAAPQSPGEPVAIEPSAATDEIAEKLERAERKLERALERVDDLTDKVRDSQQEAAVSAALAQQAAQFSVALTEQSAQAPAVRERQSVVYYGVPVIHNTARGFEHRNFRHSKFKHHQFKHHRRGIHRGKINGFSKFDRQRKFQPKTIRIHFKNKSKFQHRHRSVNAFKIR